MPSSSVAETSSLFEAEEEDGEEGEVVEEAEEYDEKREQIEEKKEEEEEEEQGTAHSVRPYMAVREKPESMKKRGMMLEAVKRRRWEGGREGRSE